MTGRRRHTGPLEVAPVGGGAPTFLQEEGGVGLGPKALRVPVQTPFPRPTCSPVLCHCPQNGHWRDSWAGCGCSGDSHHGPWGGRCGGCLRGHSPNQGRGGFNRCRAGGTWQRAGGPVWQAWAQLPGLSRVPNVLETAHLPQGVQPPGRPRPTAADRLPVSVNAVGPGTAQMAHTWPATASPVCPLRLH